MYLYNYNYKETFDNMIVELSQINNLHVKYKLRPIYGNVSSLGVKEFAFQLSMSYLSHSQKSQTHRANHPFS